MADEGSAEQKGAEPPLSQQWQFRQQSKEEEEEEAEARAPFPPFLRPVSEMQRNYVDDQIGAPSLQPTAGPCTIFVQLNLKPVSPSVPELKNPLK